MTIKKNEIPDERTVIYIFGNPLLPFDNLPIKLLPKLKSRFPDINFIIKDPNENLDPKNKELIIIDTIIDGDKVTVLEDLNKIELDKIYTAHDFDLGFNLKLLKKIGKIKKVLIFGIPSKLKPDIAFNQLTELIKKLQPVNF